jgi:hypothetical protein
MRAKRWAARRPASVDTPTPLKAIETRFDGYRFRSRLEARWAVFFKALGVRYEYEKEGYDLGAAGWYLPDFWLPEQECWVEVKGVVDDRSRRCAQELAQKSKKAVYIARSVPGEGIDLLGYEPSFEYDGDGGWEWAECWWCGHAAIALRGCGPHVGCANVPFAVFRSDTPRLRAAYEAARSARFEHGARG